MWTVAAIPGNVPNLGAFPRVAISSPLPESAGAIARKGAGVAGVPAQPLGALLLLDAPLPTPEEALNPNNRSHPTRESARS